MNQINWMDEITSLDTAEPLKDFQGEELYTLYLSDFFRMPDIDYGELAEYDPAVRALRN